MPEIEKNFKKLMLKIGIAMLIFFVAFNVFFSVWMMIDTALFGAFDVVTATVISQLLYGFFYAASFALPAIILAVITKNDKEPLIKSPKLSWKTPLYIVGGIAIILSFAYLNSMFVSPFGGGITDESWVEAYDEPYEIILQLITVAVAPGIFEEFLFRGVMLAKLRPYGKTPAILISALLFALMHQNAAQFLYAFAAGIALGFIATETGALLPCILVHFTNNAFSVLEQAALANMPEELFSAVFYPIEFMIFAIGIVSFIVVAYSYYKKKKKNDFSEGMFAKELALEDKTEGFVISAKKTVKYFFSPTVIVFICISLLEAGVLLGLSYFGVPFV